MDIIPQYYLFTLNILFLILITGGNSGLGVVTFTTAIIDFL